MAHERIPELMNVAPPAEVDALVQHRARVALSRMSHRSEAGAGTTSAIESRSSAATPLPWAERWVYAVGLAAYGCRAAWGAARLFWDIVTG